MIRQPEFVTPDVFDWAVRECAAKKPDVDLSRARLTSFSEGLCVQMMHIGSYDEETRSMEQLQAFMTTNGLLDESGSTRKHHEIYLSDPRRTTAEKFKTVLRLPVRRIPA